MPEAVENLLPRGDGYGQTQARQEFIQGAADANAGPAYQIQPPAPRSTPPVPRPEPVNEAMPDNTMSLPDGTPLDLNEVLFAPTERPSEPVTQGLSNAPSIAPVSSILQRGVDAGYSTPGMREMLMRARAYGL